MGGTLTTQEALASLIAEHAEGRKRLMVAIAGPPGAGKSTLAARLVLDLNVDDPKRAIVVPMDGFHYDDAVLEARGLLARKGAPQTFDVDGLAALLERMRASGSDVAIPLFDRNLEIARAGAAIVERDHRILVVEGNYLLLSETPWAGLRDLFDLTIGLQLPLAELERRLMQRWLDQGLGPREARRRVESNDIPNAKHVLSHFSEPHYVVSGSRG